MMNHSTYHKIGRVVAYTSGVALIFFAVLDLSVAIVLGEHQFLPFASRVFDVSFIICGVLICVATRLRYSGGFCFILGAIFVAGAITTTAAILEAYMRGEHFRNPISWYLRDAIFFGVGCSCLVLGHLRHRKKMSPPNTALEPTPTAH